MSENAVFGPYILTKKGNPNVLIPKLMKPSQKSKSYKKIMEAMR